MKKLRLTINDNEILLCEQNISSSEELQQKQHLVFAVIKDDIAMAAELIADKVSSNIIMYISSVQISLLDIAYQINNDEMIEILLTNGTPNVADESTFDKEVKHQVINYLIQENNNLKLLIEDEFSNEEEIIEDIPSHMGEISIVNGYEFSGLESIYEGFDAAPSTLERKFKANSLVDADSNTYTLKEKSLTDKHFTNINKEFNQICAIIFKEIFYYYKKNDLMQAVDSLNYNHIIDLPSDTLIELINGFEKKKNELTEDIEQLIRFYSNNSLIDYDKAINKISLLLLEGKESSLKELSEIIFKANLDIISKNFSKIAFYLSSETFTSFSLLPLSSLLPIEFNSNFEDICQEYSLAQEALKESLVANDSTNITGHNEEIFE